MRPEYLSASRITQYLMCPLKYRLIYVDKVERDFLPSNLVLGSSIHSAIEGFYHNWQEGVRLTSETVIELFEAYFDSGTDGKTLEPGCDREAVRNTGKSLLSVFARDVQPAEVVGIEEKFRIPLVDLDTGEIIIDLVGVFDLIELDTEGTPVVVDHKTASKRFSDADLEGNLQLTAYGLASRDLHKIDGPVLLRIDAMIKNRTPVFDQKFSIRTIETDRKFIKLAVDVLDAMDSGAFFPNTGWQCGSCQVKSSCYMEAA
jgi:putative RecB family exonuclease